MSQLDNLNVMELKQFIKSKGFTGYSKLNKKELINFISNNIFKKKKSRRSKKVIRSRSKKRRNIDMGGSCTKASCTDDDNSYYILENEDGKLRKQFERDFKAKRDTERKIEKEEQIREKKLIKKREKERKKILEKREKEKKKNLEKKEKLDEIAILILDTFKEYYESDLNIFNRYIDEAAKFINMDTLDLIQLIEYEKFVLNIMCHDYGIEGRFHDSVFNLVVEYKKNSKPNKKKLDHIATYILDYFKVQYENNLNSYNRYINEATKFIKMKNFDSKQLEEYHKFVLENMWMDTNIEGQFHDSVYDLIVEYKEIK